MRPQLLHVFPSFALGGLQTQFATVANALGERFAHRIVALDGRCAARARLASGTPYEFVDAPPGAATGLAAAPAILRFLRDQAPAAIVTYNWGAVEWCLLARAGRIAPVLHAEHGFGPDETCRLLRRRNLFRRIALAGGVRVVVPSRTLCAIARSHWGVGAQAIRHVPNGIDVADMRRRAAARAPVFVRDPAACVFGVVAPLVAVKNHAALLRVFARLSQDSGRLRLVLAGDGPERSRLEALSTGLGIRGRVDFLGALDDPAPELARCDVLVAPSLSEQMPYAVLEAMALGKPVVASDVGDIARMVAAENRPLVRPRGDDAGLAAALRELAADPCRRAALGAANLARCRAVHDAARMCTAYGSLYAETIATG